MFKTVNDFIGWCLHLIVIFLVVNGLERLGIEEWYYRVLYATLAYFMMDLGFKLRNTK